MNTILNGRLTWSGIKDRWRNVYVGALTLRQISDIIGDKVPKIKQFINSVENMLEYRNNILEEISKLNLKQNQMVVVTLTNRVVTRERSDPKTGEKKLLSTDTSQTHSLSVIQK
jgi:adenylate kinase family enzyme